MTAYLLGWFTVAGAFIAGCAWHAWLHRCRPVGVHDLDEAYARGLADERVRRESEIRRLERMAR